MRFVELSTATTLAVDLPERADATPTFVVRGPSGGVVQASSAVTLDTVNTTLASAAAAGAQTVSVTSATGLIVGRKYQLAGNENVYRVLPYHPAMEQELAMRLYVDTYIFPALATQRQLGYLYRDCGLDLTPPAAAHSTT